MGCCLPAAPLQRMFGYKGGELEGKNVSCLVRVSTHRHWLPSAACSTVFTVIVNRNNSLRLAMYQPELTVHGPRMEQTYSCCLNASFLAEGLHAHRTSALLHARKLNVSAQLLPLPLFVDLLCPDACALQHPPQHVLGKLHDLWPTPHPGHCKTGKWWEGLSLEILQQ